MTHHQDSPHKVHCIHCGAKQWEELSHADWMDPRAWSNTWTCGACGYGLVTLKISTITEEQHRRLTTPLERHLDKYSEPLK